MFSKVRVPKKTYRLVPTKYPPIQTFDDVASEQDLEAIMEIEGWTNDRLVKQRLQRLPKDQWVYNVSNASIIMAAFLHAPIYGLRFNNGELGAWYCSTHVTTAIAEVATHLQREANNCGMREIRSQYRSYSATLAGKYLDIRGKQSQLPDIYHTNNWHASQAFGEQHRSQGEHGIYYNSVRHKKGSNIVAFWPKQISAVTIGSSYELIVPQTGKIIAQKLA